MISNAEGEEGEDVVQEACGLSPETLRRLQLTELDVLRAVRAACDALGVEYFLDSGTLLGAVRHGGFIPWDDDIDVGMRRADFERFLSGAADALPAGYSLHTFDNTPGFAGMFAKVYKDGTSFETAETREAGCPQGIFVDVFPYDDLPADSAERTRRLRRAGLWQRVSYLHHAGAVTVPFAGVAGALARGACRVMHGVVRMLFSREGIRSRFDAATAPAGDTSGLFASYAYPEFGPFPADVLFPVGACLFEGERFSCPHDPLKYLELAYGPNWNVLPPESQRRTHAPLSLDFGEQDVRDGSAL